MKVHRPAVDFARRCVADAASVQGMLTGRVASAQERRWFAARAVAANGAGEAGQCRRCIDPA